MYNEWLFLETLKDIEQRLGSRSTFDKLIVASHLRKLLLDSPTLVSNINESRLKIRFRLKRDQFVTLSSPIDLGPYAAWSMRGATWGSKFEKLSIDDFLSLPVLRFRDQIYTAREIILVNANKNGGIHFKPTKPRSNTGNRPIIGRLFESSTPGPPLNPIDQLNKDLDRYGTYWRVRIDIKLIKPIAMITLKGVNELKWDVVRWLDKVGVS